MMMTMAAMMMVKNIFLISNMQRRGDNLISLAYRGYEEVSNYTHTYNFQLLDLSQNCLRKRLSKTTNQTNERNKNS